jgi:hypothetical protein
MGNKVDTEETMNITDWNNVAHLLLASYLVTTPLAT